MPEERPVYVDVDGYAGIFDCELEIAIGIDDFINEDVSTRRYAGFPNGFFDTHGLHSSRLYLLGPGSHTIYFLAQITENVGPESYFARANYMSITALVFGGGGIQLSASRNPEMRGDPGVEPDGLILE